MYIRRIQKSEALAWFGSS